MPILDTQLNIWSTQKQIFERKPEHDSALVVPIKSAQLRCASSTSHNNQQGEVLQNSFLSPQASIGFPHCGQVGGSTGAAHHNDLKSRHEPTFNPQSPYNTTTPNLHCWPFNIYPCFSFSQPWFPWKKLSGCNKMATSGNLSNDWTMFSEHVESWVHFAFKD